MCYYHHSTPLDTYGPCNNLHYLGHVKNVYADDVGGGHDHAHGELMNINERRYPP